jgi:methyl-accepting chemotaxis protein
MFTIHAMVGKRRNPINMPRLYAYQQNASASEELAATSEELSGQAEQLQQSIAFFKTEGDTKVKIPLAPLATERRAGAVRLVSGVRSASVRGSTNGNFKPY